MSVPEYRRKEGKFEVLNKALEMCCYTLKITSNQKVFPPEYDEKITNDIVAYAKIIYLNAWAANNIVVRVGFDGAEEYKNRSGFQAAAISDCTKMLACINIAKKVFHLKEKRFDYWTGLITETRSMLRQWKESDKQRYKNMLGL